MTEKELEELIRSVGSTYRQPADPDREAIWHQIEGRAFGTRTSIAARRPVLLHGLAYAAVLVIGIGIGSLARSGPSARPAAPPPESAGLLVPASTASEPSPFVGVARDYFQQSTALIVSVAADLRTGHILPGTMTRARELLSTTRLLLDGNLPDPALRDLLQDLELVLAQVVQLPAGQPAPDAQLIAETMDQREVLSRLTLVLADAH